MEQKAIEHHAAVTVDAPVHQVYSLFSHFNDFPKFMSFVKEVTYYDMQRSHWVADVAGRREWDAENENWIPDQQIGWHSVNGLRNAGRVVFQPINTQQTRVDVSIAYEPPAGVLGNIGEHMGVGRHFENVLQQDLNHFAEMVHHAPPGALDPTSSNYLFHPESAAARGTTTERQNATMEKDYYAAAAGGETPLEQPTLDRDIVNEPADRVPPPGQRDATASPAYPDTDEANLPPEQIPPWQPPQGNQPQP